MCASSQVVVSALTIVTAKSVMKVITITRTVMTVCSVILLRINLSRTATVWHVLFLTVMTVPVWISVLSVMDPRTMPSQKTLPVWNALLLTICSSGMVSANPVSYLAATTVSVSLSVPNVMNLEVTTCWEIPVPSVTRIRTSS